MRGEKVYSNPAVSDSGAGSWNCVSPTWMCGSLRQLAYLLHVPSLGSQETSVFCWRWSNPTNRAHMTGRTKFKCRNWRDGSCIKSIFGCLRMSTWQQTNLSNSTFLNWPLWELHVCGGKTPTSRSKSTAKWPNMSWRTLFQLCGYHFSYHSPSQKLEADWFAFPDFFRPPLLNVFISWDAWNNVVMWCWKPLCMLWMFYSHWLIKKLILQESGRI